MTETLTTNPRTELAKLVRWPGTHNTGPIFGGRTISAMGCRPQDHMDRDLLLASLLRDRRLRMFRKQCLAMPAWAPALPENIPENFQHRAQELIMLGSHQQYLIEKMRDTIYLAADRCQGEKMLNAMEACVPRGAFFARTTLDSGHACGYARLCPWCHARSVQRLYRQLLAGPCTPERLAGKHLIVFRTRVEAGEELHADEAREARGEYRYKLRCMARDIGIEGGVILHQVTPWIPRYDRPEEKQKGFAHIFTMIGVVRQQHGRDARRCHKGVWLQTYGSTGTMKPHGCPPPRRMPSATCSSGHPTSSTAANSESSSMTRKGCNMASRVPRHWSRGFSSISSRHGLTQQPCKEPGSMTALAIGGSRRPDASNARGFDATKSKYGNENRQMAFQGENNRRCHDANARRRQLIAVALPCYKTLKDIVGKPPGSPALRKALHEAGHVVSDRDARWLAKYLPAKAAEVIPAVKSARPGLENFIAQQTLHQFRGNPCDPHSPAPVAIA